jgi:hypothetical protein
MRIENLQGDRFELKILGYQFPWTNDDRWDSNWLLIKTIASLGGWSWSAVCPCLTTFEVAELAVWFEALDGDLEGDLKCAFTEPNLEFQVVTNDTGERLLRIFFELESRPLWASSNIAYLKDLWLDFNLSAIDLPVASHELISELKEFPQRG